MRESRPDLKARAADRMITRHRGAGADRAGWLARNGAESTVKRLHQQACVELDALAALLATQRCGEEPAASQLAALARTLDRIGSWAEKLEREMGQMRHCAYHDPLTGLPNRTLLLDRLDRALAQAARRNGQVALLMLDLDDFKAANDRFGHAAGDQLLRGVADRLQRSARDADTICRYGGDEFVILLPEVDGRPGATVVAEKIQASLSTPFLVDGLSITVRACVGVAVYPLDGVAPIHLLQRADVAMYGAKDDPARRQPSEALE